MDPVLKAAGAVVLVAVAARVGWELLRPALLPVALAGVVWWVFLALRRERSW